MSLNFKDQVFLRHPSMRISKEKEMRLRELYEQLGINEDGTIDMRDLANALKQKVPHIPSDVVSELFAQINHLNDNAITFPAFVQYAIEHEKELETIFHDLDGDRDGCIGVQEIKKYCDDLGIPITETKAKEIVKGMSGAKSSPVSFSEFKDFMLLYPRSKPEEIAKFWTHNLVNGIDQGGRISENFSQQDIASGFWWKHLVAGGVAGCVSRTCTAPLDRVKIYLQVHATVLNRLRFPKAAKLLYEEGGLKSFWRGNGVNVAKIAPESGIRFLAYDIVKRMIVKHRGEDHKIQISDRLAAGSAAGVVSQAIIYPLEVLKTRLALRRSDQSQTGLVYLATKMYMNEGLPSFYKGFVPNLIGIIPCAGIDLAIYETLKSYYINNYNADSVHDIIALPACGACSSVCGMLASYPFALVRTRLQALAVSGNSTQPDTMNGQIRYIWRNDGLYGFYRGFTANLVKAVPAVAISYYVYEHVRTWLGASMIMKNARDVGITFPSALSNDEKHLKEMFEKLRIIRKAIAATNKVNISGTIGDNLKNERKTTKRHLQQAQEATEEVRRKVLIGAVSFKKADEKKDSFKRSSLVGRRRTNNSAELSPLNADDGFDTYKPFSSGDHSGTKKKMEEPSDDFDTYKPFCDSGTRDVSGRNPGTSSVLQTVSSASDNFDTYRERTSTFDTYKPVGVDESDFDASASSFDTYKPDGFDNYKPVTQLFSSNAGNRSHFVGFEQPKPCKGPCLYIRGYDLVTDSLRNVFSKYGVISRVFVEERQKSAFITYATTEEAEVAIKEMDGNMVNGITLRVSFARRQNQCGDSGRNFRSYKSFDRGNDGDGRGGGDLSNRFRGERNSRFRSNERARFRGDKCGRGRGRGRKCESGNSSVTGASTENNDDFWSGGNKASNYERQAMEASYDKDDFGAAGRRSPEKTSGQRGDDEEESEFDTYKSTISASEKDDFINKEDDGFDTWKPSINDGKDVSGAWSRRTERGNCRGNLGKRHGGFRHLDEERQGGFGDDKYRSLRGGGRGNGMTRRGRNHGGQSWQTRKRSSEVRNGYKDDFRTSDDRPSNEHSKSSDDRETDLQKKDNDKNDFWSEEDAASHHFSSKGDESCSFSVEKSDGDQSVRESARDHNRYAKRQRYDFNNKMCDEENKSSHRDEWADVDSKPTMDSLPASASDMMGDSPSRFPPMSEVQVAWSEATKKTSKKMMKTTAAKNEETTVTQQHKPEIRTQISYGEDDPFA